MENFAEHDLPILTSGFGMRVGGSTNVALARVFSIIFFSGSFVYPLIGNPSLAWKIIYSLLFMLAQFSIKFSLYILSFLVDKSFEISSDNEDEVIPTIENNSNLPQSLWDHIRDFSKDKPFTEDMVIKFISDGYNPEDVYMFYTIVTRNDYSLIRNHQNSNKNKRGLYLNCCGSIIPFRITRKFVESVFPNNNSLLYVLIGSIFIFFTYFLSFYVNIIFPTWSKYSS